MLQPGETFTQEFLIGVSGLEDGASANFDVSLDTYGEVLTEDKKIDDTVRTLIFTQPGAVIVGRWAARAVSGTAGGNKTVKVDYSDKKCEYSDYGYGTHSTYKYFVTIPDYDISNGIAFCIQPEQPGPVKKTYTDAKITSIGKNNSVVALIIYYAQTGKGFFAQTGYDADQRYIIGHIAASIAAGQSSNYSKETNQNAIDIANKLIAYCKTKLPMSFSSTSLTVAGYTNDSNGWRKYTNSTTFQGNSEQTFTMNLPDKVKLHTGSSTYTGKVTISGGTTFYLSAPVTYTEATRSYSEGELYVTGLTAYDIFLGYYNDDTSNEKRQKLAFITGKATEGEANFNVTWNSVSKITLKKTNASGAVLSGAEFEIRNSSNAERATYMDGTFIETLTTNSNGTVTLSKLLAPGTYYLRETKAPSGYRRMSDLKFTVNNNGTVTVGSSNTDNTVTAKNQGTIVKFAKTDANGNRLAGATLKITTSSDPNSTAYNGLQWKSTTSYKEVTGLPHGTYYLHEVTAPAGYKLAAPVSFTVNQNSDGTGTAVVTMKNTETEIKVGKTGEGLSGYLAGATLQIARKSDNAEIDTWTSTTEVHTVKKLETGVAYILREVSAPSGYAKAADIEFTLDTSGKIISTNGTQLTMKDHQTRIKFAKVDDRTGNYVAGATLQIQDANGKAVILNGQELTWTSAETPHEIVGLPHGNYYLVEIAVPENSGYTIAQPVPFQVTDGDGAAESTVRIENIKNKESQVLITKQFNPVYTMKDNEKVVFEILNASGALVREVEITNASQTAVVEGLVPGTYTLHEKSAPAGFVKAADRTFTVATTSVGTDGKVVPAHKAAVTNKATEISIQKVDSKGNGFSGALLQIRKVNSNGIKGDVAVTAYDETLTWTSDGEPKHIRGLEAGTYVLEELAAPTGYTKAEDIKFEVTEEGVLNILTENPDGGADLSEPAQGNTITMQDKATVMRFAKVDSEGNYVENAELAIYMEDISAADNLGKKVTHWTTGKETFKIEGMLHGAYYLVETKAPSGYATAHSVRFEVKDESYGTEVIQMIDCLTRVQITKSMEQPSEEMKAEGAENYILSETDPAVFKIYKVMTEGEEKKEELVPKLQILREDGTRETASELKITKDGEKVIIEGLEIGQYILRETQSPAGYTITADVPFEITSAMVENENVSKLHYADEVKNKATQVLISKQDIAGNGEELPGATLQVLDADGNVAVTVYGEKMEWVSGNEAKLMKGLPAGTYKLHEVYAPDGYALTEDVEFTVTQDLNVLHTATMKDATTKFHVSKKDIANQEKELPGAKLQILDENENVATTIYYVDDETTPDEKLEWISGETPKYIEGLKTGKYILREIVAPTGFSLAADIYFELTPKGDVVVDNTKCEDNVLTMLDTATEVEISKVSITDNKELPGASLQVLDEDGNVATTVYYVDDETTPDQKLEWTSGEGPRVFKGLPVGKYTLKETAAPEGYVISAPVEFEVTTDGIAKKVVMADDITKIHIIKTDAATGKELAGAHLILRDAQGNLVDEWISTTQAHKIEGKLTAGESYTLTEIEAPQGYKITQSITFTVNTDGGVNEVVMKDEVADGESSLTVRKYVKMNDEFIALDYDFYVALFADAAYTERVSSVMALEVRGSYTTSVTFENLDYGTYYVAETDLYGNPVTGDDVVESIETINSIVELTPEAATAQSTLVNHIGDLGQDYYMDGQIAINKQVKINGKAAKVTDKFYFALFVDKELTMMADAGVKVLMMNNASKGSIIFDDLPYGEYYVAEVDKNGVPVDRKFAYDVTIDQEYCELDGENSSAVINVINAKEVETESKIETQKDESVDTRDSNPIGWTFLGMAISLITAIFLLIMNRRKSNA